VPRSASLSDAALMVRGVTHRYGRHTALHDVALSALAGTVTCLVGPNGSGKSTLVHGLAGLHRPQSGVISIGGHPPGSRAAAVRAGFSYDDVPLPATLTGAELLDLLASAHPHWDGDLIADLVELLGLTRDVPRLIAEYSCGMRRKLRLVASLGHRPGVWVLDEPFAGLDPVAVGAASALVQHFRKSGGTVLIATRDLAAVSEVADQVVVLADGRVRSAGPLADLVRSSGALAASYLDLTGLAARMDLAEAALPGVRLTAAHVL
jgi:ABC-2 type transport system ATP-binding protein